MVATGTSLEDTKLQVKRPFVGTIGELMNLTLSIPIGKTRVHHRIESKNSQTQ
ncbi:hypothetical protein DYB26_011924, partial [Aphanomyces astaci]